MLFCKFCDKECKNNNSLINHQRLCKNNESRQFTPFHSSEFQKSKSGKCWNQYTKAAALGLPKPEVSLETRKKLSDKMKLRTPEFCKEIGSMVSKTVNDKVSRGEWHTSLAKHMHIDYNGIDLHGSWELKYAQYLDANNIKWIRNKDIFHYEFDGKSRRYTPDFYLIESDEYVEIKGYKTDKDDAKWSQFPKHRTLIVLMRTELKNIGVL